MQRTYQVWMSSVADPYESPAKAQLAVRQGQLWREYKTTEFQHVYGQESCLGSQVFSDVSILKFLKTTVCVMLSDCGVCQDVSFLSFIYLHYTGFKLKTSSYLHRLALDPYLFLLTTIL